MKYKVVLFLLSVAFAAQAQDHRDAYEARVHEKDGEKLNYRVMYPADFPDNGPYPLVIFMHGAGERGSDNSSQLVHGSKLFRDSLDKYPAVVLFPQCPEDNFWSTIEVENRGKGQFKFKDDVPPTTPLALTIDLMNHVISEGHIDENRIYISGLSMGGMATWELLWRMPGTFAAAMPICGGGAAAQAKNMTDVPIWAFHGKLDDIVPPRYSVRMVTAVQDAGGIAKITIYPEANHNSWDPAFAESQYLAWMFSQSRAQ